MSEKPELPKAGMEETVGHMLRRERELRGVTLVEVAAATRISKAHLEALEADRPEDLPGGVFTRGFLRNYADYLGLDAEAVLLHSLQQQQRLATRTLAGASGGALGLTTIPGGWGLDMQSTRRSRWMLAVALLILLVVAFLALSQWHGGRPAVSAPLRPGSGAAASPPASAPAPVPLPASANAGPVNFELMPGPDDRRVFVRLTVDGELKYQGELKRTDRLQYSGKVFELYTPSAGALQLRIDGKLYPPLGRRGETLNGWSFRAGQGVVAAASAP